MSDLEALMRSTLGDQAAEISPDPDAVAAAVAAVQRRQHRRQNRRRLVAAVAAAAAVAGIVVVTTAVNHGRSQPDLSTQPTRSTVTSAPASTSASSAATATAPPPTAATTTPSSSATGTATGGADLASLAVRRIGIINTVLGPDYGDPGRQTSGWGDLVLTLGSPTAVGLPAGYNAAATASLLPPTSDVFTGPVDTLSELCKGMVEKGATTKPCVTVKDGVTVYRSVTDAPNTKIGTWATLRILYERPDQLVVYTQITIYNTGHPTTDQERVAAATWLNNQEDKLALAATTGP